MPVVHTYYYTDPICPWSWALEPAWRKLAFEFGGSLSVTYVMCGMARVLGDTTPLVSEMLEASAQSGMPLDARMWLAGAPRSSHPACLAVIAAAEQGDPAPYLRRLREGLLCRRRKLDTADALIEEARGVSGLDVERLRVALGSHAILEAFGGDLERCGAVPAEHHSPGTGRVSLPSLEFRGSEGAVHGVYGFCDYGALRAAAVAAGASAAGAFGSGGSAGASASPGSAGPPSIEDALRRFGTMATAEVAAVCDLPGPRAPAELWRLALEWRVRAERVGTGYLWSLA
ncbi:MAG: DsbA family protein [Solirubrobacterales bacterium]|nr:DsbA family protein [Solirubrobacterales bacterium]